MDTKVFQRLIWVAITLAAVVFVLSLARSCSSDTDTPAQPPTNSQPPVVTISPEPTQPPAQPTEPQVPKPPNHSHTPGTHSTETYRVVPGDTLWDISAKHLGDPFKWYVIYHLNDSEITDPDLIFPGQVFSLPKN